MNEQTYFSRINLQYRANLYKNILFLLLSSLHSFHTDIPLCWMRYNLNSPYKIYKAKMQRLGVKNYAIGARTMCVCTHCVYSINRKKKNLIQNLSAAFFLSLVRLKKSKRFSVINNYRSPMRHYSVSHPLIRQQPIAFTCLFNFALNSDFTWNSSFFFTFLLHRRTPSRFVREFRLKNLFLFFSLLFL